MTFWLVFIFCFFGTLFVFKMLYVCAAALALPQTGGALYVSTSGKKIKAFLDAIPMTPNQVLIDLGCGDGRVLRSAGRKYSIKGIGYEINLMACLYANILCFGCRRIEIRRCSFWNRKLTEADVVFCYLFPDVLKKLADKFRKELRPGTIVVSCNFPIPGFQAERIIRLSCPSDQDPIFIYSMGDAVL